MVEVLRELGRELRAARRGNGMSQDELAAASGVDQGTISRIERGQAPGLRFATYARLLEIVEGAGRRAAEQARILEETREKSRPPWLRVPPPWGPLTFAQWMSPTPPRHWPAAGAELPAADAERPRPAPGG